MSDEQKLLAACVDYRAKLDALEAENAALRADNAAAHALVLDLRAKEHSERTLAVRLEKEHAALRADKARLDWLERRTVSRLQAVLDHVELHKLPIREAIDLAIEEIRQ
jgi:hypothetical protein